MVLPMIIGGASDYAVWAANQGIDSVPTPQTVAADSLADSLRHALADSMAVDSATTADSTAVDSLATDSVHHKAKSDGPSRIVRTRADLDNVVNFKSSDSMVIIRRDSAFMYGDGNVSYGEIKLAADNIQMNLGNSTVYAIGTTDSLGEIKGKPVFNQGQDEYEAKTMNYNFKTQKGYITDVITQQGEGYLTGGVTKKDINNEYYIKDGRYTTCEDHEDPHFYFNVTKGKVRPGKNIVTGPTYMVLAGLPLPIAVPFGYFPFSQTYSSGVIVPTFGDDYNRGFYLRDGGYYFAINDNIDLALTGEIYTKGSWGLTAQSSYVKRYKFSGNFNLSYLKTIYGEKGSPDYSSQTNFQVLWSHTQDTKANPNMSLSASVNFTTSGYSRNDLNSYYSSSFTENTKSSTINMTYRFPQSKWSLSSTFNISQRTQDSTLTVSFPNINITMSQTYPFKRKHSGGSDERWYEKIKLSYSGQLQNSLTSKQDQFFQKSLIKDWRNGMKHSIPISATFNLFRYLNLTPSINVTDRMYTSKIRRQWDPNAAVEVCDTSYSFYNVWDFNASVSLDTKIYGFFQPLGFLGKKVKMIRHVMTPTISFSGAPDFSSAFFGYYDQYQYTNNAGQLVTKQYSMFSNGLYGTPSSGKTGAISVSLANNLEMKTRSVGDSIEEKKISLIENFTVSQSYNFAADSLNWSNINTSLLLRLTKGFNLNLSGVWDVYTYQLNSSGNPVRVNIPRWQAGKGIGRLSSTGTSFSYTFNNDTFKRKDKNKDKDKGKGNNNEAPDTPDSGTMNDRKRKEKDDDDTEVGEDGYAKWTVPWSLSVNYSVSYGYGTFNKEKMEYDGKITQNLSFSGNIKPTNNWSFSFSASYNFDTHKLAYMNCNVSRDLHCFTMRAGIVPVGPYKSYTFNIAVKSAMLSDLKYDKRSSTSNGVKWY
jgi:lipopolysaccharide assembly outer membrane protein LptD (OstA)